MVTIKINSRLSMLGLWVCIVAIVMHRVWNVDPIAVEPALLFTAGLLLFIAGALEPYTSDHYWN